MLGSNGGATLFLNGFDSGRDGRGDRPSAMQVFSLWMPVSKVMLFTFYALPDSNLDSRPLI